MRVKIRQMCIDIFSNKLLLELADCLFCFIWIRVMMEKAINTEGIFYQNVPSSITPPSLMETDSMTNQLTLI